MSKFHTCIDVSTWSAENVAHMIAAVHKLATKVLGPPGKRWGIITDGRHIVVATMHRKDKVRFEKALAAV